MNNPWVDNALRPAKLMRGCPSAGATGQIGLGGPIPVTVELRDDLPLVAAFYDQESDTLSVHILPFEPYYASVESGDIRIDTDEYGRPVFMEVTRPGEGWHVDPAFSVPVADSDGVLRFREIRRRFSPGTVYADQRRENVCVKFLARQGQEVIRLAENLLAETADGFLVALWVLGLKMDFAGRKQTRWRVATALRLRRSGRRWRCYSRGELAEELRGG